MTLKRGHKLLPLQDLLKEADQIYLDRTLAFPETEKKLTGEQREEFLESAAEEIKKRSELLDRECVKVGKTLFSVKQRVKRAEFRTWVIKCCPFSYRTAQNYISLFRVTLDRPELLCLKKSVLYLIGSDNFPEALRDYICDTLLGVYEVGLKDVLKLQTGYLNGTLDLNSDAFTKHLVKKEQDELHHLFAAGWQRTITKLENEKKRYQSYIDRQKKIGAASFNNKPKKLCKSTISILDKAISDMSALERHGTVTSGHEKKSDRPVNTPQDEPIWDPSDQVFDEMKKMEFERQAPDDLFPIMSEDRAAELLEQERYRELAPEDLSLVQD